MEFYRISFLALVVCILQVGALPSEDNNENQHIHALADVGKSIYSLTGAFHEAKNTLTKFKNCGSGTHFQMIRLAAEKLEDFQACINITSELANLELYGFHSYEAAAFFINTLIDLVKNIFDCFKNQSGGYSKLNCTLTEIQNTGPDFDQFLSRLKVLLAELEFDSDNLITYIKRCFHRSSSEYLTEVHSMINNNC